MTMSERQWPESVLKKFREIEASDMSRWDKQVAKKWVTHGPFGYLWEREMLFGYKSEEVTHE